MFCRGMVAKAMSQEGCHLAVDVLAQVAGSSPKQGQSVYTPHYAVFFKRYSGQLNWVSLSLKSGYDVYMRKPKMGYLKKSDHNQDTS